MEFGEVSHWGAFYLWISRGFYWMTWVKVMNWMKHGRYLYYKAQMAVKTAGLIYLYTFLKSLLSKSKFFFSTK